MKNFTMKILFFFALATMGMVATGQEINDNSEPISAQLGSDSSLALSGVQQGPQPQFVVADDGFHLISDHLNAQRPHHYYGFVALRGQDVLLGLPNGEPEQEAWKVEYNIEGDWEALNFRSKVFKGLAPGSNVIVRVTPRVTKAVNDIPYAITFGSYPVMKRYDLLDEPGVLRIPSGYTVPSWLATQIYKETVLEVEFKDTKGAPLKGGIAFLELSYGKGEKSIKRVLVSDAQGRASERIDLGRCYGGDEAQEFVDKQMGFNTWKGRYRVARYHIRNISLGSLEAKPHIYYLGHICRQRVQKTVAPRG